MTSETHTDGTGDAPFDFTGYYEPTDSLVDLMKMIGGGKGFPIMVRFDPWRDSHNFTVTIGNIRVADTDNPVQTINDYISQKR